jgi:hypothetical protein
MPIFINFENNQSSFGNSQQINYLFFEIKIIIKITIILLVLLFFLKMKNRKQ